MNPRYSRYYTFIKPIARNRYVKTYSSLIFSLLAIAVFSLFAIKPTISTILILQKNIEQQQQVLDALSQKAQNLSLGKQNLNKIDPVAKAKINSLLPDKTDPASLIDSLNSLAISNQASISGLQLQPVEVRGIPNKLTKDPTLNEIDFTFNVTGTYQTLVNTLNSLISSNRLISIDSVSINKTSEDALVMSINAKAYFLAN